MKLSALGFRLSALTFIFTIGISHALDPMYNYRYTLGPEILVPDAFFVSFGVWTHRNEDFSMSSNLQLSITDEFEIGARYIPGTKDDWVLEKTRERKHAYHLIDIGAKFAITPNTALQIDAPMSLNRDRPWGGVVSLSQWESYTKNVSFLYEGRVGFLGASGPDNHAKLSAAFSPYFQLGNAFRISVCTIGSFSFENFKNDAMLDILPRMEAGFTAFRVMTEVSIGILTWEAKKYNRYALFIVSDV